LLGAGDAEIASDSSHVLFPMWPCADDPAGPHGMVRLAAQADTVVETAVVEVPSTPDLGWVMLIDDLAFAGGEPDAECADAVPAFAAEDLCDAEPGPDERGAYLCVPMPDTVASCDECDLQCMQQATEAAATASGSCLPLPSRLVCGPDPNAETDGECCYVVASGEDTCGPD
jgi:hypothetical protein